MNAFIQKNKKLLKFYYVALRLSGWILLTLGVCSYGIIIFLARNLGAETFGAIAVNMPLNSLHLILFGILGLGIAQLIQYLFDSESKPGFVLRHGNKFLYIYVVIIFIAMAVRNVYAIKHLLYADISNAQFLFFATSITSVILFAAKALVIIGVAQFLKRLLPVIEEHKTLV